MSDIRSYMCERRLYQQIILQAFADVVSKGTHLNAEFERRQALHWLLYNKRDFTIVCHHAGLDPERVRNCFKKLYATSDAAEKLTRPKTRCKAKEFMEMCHHANS